MSLSQSRCISGSAWLLNRSASRASAYIPVNTFAVFLLSVSFFLLCGGAKSDGGGVPMLSQLDELGFHQMGIDLRHVTAQQGPAEESAPQHVEIRYRDTFAPFVEHAQQQHRRMGTLSEDGLCMSLEFNAVNVTIEDEEDGDACAANYEGKEGANFCLDPYFGGLLGCCYQEGTCFTCQEVGNCTEISIECSASYVQECSLTSSSDILSDTFKARQSTCAFVGDTGYWYQPGYLFLGEFSVVQLANTDSVDECAEMCSQVPRCNALTWRSTDFSCNMLRGFAEGFAPCDGLCSETDQVYILDADGLYCAPESLECACTREYHNCMSFNMCGNSLEEQRSVSDMCHSRNCSVVQCGLAPVRYGCGVAECGNGFLECKLDGRGACDCIKEYVDCTSGFEDFHFEALSNEGWSFSELCSAEGCTAEECGIPDTVCNSSALSCGSDYVDCVGQGIDCECVQAYRGCMEQFNCIYDTLKTSLLDTCAISGCQPEDCGFTQSEVLTLGCSEYSRMECSSEYLHCMEYTAECGCMRAKFGCLVRWGCEISEAILSESIDHCVDYNCTAQECGLCESTCNVTQLFCVTAYESCVVRASSSSQRCACSSDFYGCIAGGDCMTDEIRAAHLELCVNDECTAAACGIEDVQVCNQTDLACTESFIDCQRQRLDPDEDRCALNYERFSGLGSDFCNRTTFGGLPGCNYDEEDDSCYTSGDCACSRDYYHCMRRGCVEESPALEEFTRLCAERGCTAVQCGVEDTAAAKSCNLTSLMCANDFLQCAYGDGEQEALSSGADGPFCSQTFCLRYYYACMKEGLCTDDEDELEHLKFCTAAGCTNEQCGLLIEPEEEEIPDLPSGTLTSLPGLDLEVGWQPSRLSLLWAALGSINQVLQFEVRLESECERLEPETECQVLDLDDSFRFYDPRVATFVGIRPGSILKLTVRQRNVHGVGPDFVLTQRHVGVPSAPVDLATERVGSLRVAASWGLPANTGDFSQNVVLDAYILEIIPRPRQLAVQLVLPPSTFSAVIIHYVGGTFFNCSQEGELCVCSGLLRFGDGTTWSEPVRLRSPGRTMCEVGDVFPETRLVPSLGDARYCQCSYDAVELEKGEELVARVAAENFVGRGNFTAPSTVKVMGRPSPVEELVVSELEQSMLVTWNEPLDTGFGENDPEPAQILEYLVYIAECPTFMPRGCEPNIFFVAAAQCEDGACQFEIAYDSEGTLFPLIAGSTYYLTVVATNEVASGYLFYAPVFRRTWKIKPIIVSPTRDNFPLRVAEYGSSTKIWLRGGSGVDSLVLIVDNFGQIDIGATIEVDFVKGDVVRRAGLRLYDKQLTTDQADFGDPLGVEVRNLFLFEAPVFGTGEGPASGVMEGGEGFQVTIDLEYFEYPKPEVSLLPTVGPLGGGNFAQVSFTEFIETQTRYAAGLPNFKSSDPSSIRIVFGGRTATILQTSDPTLDIRNFLIEVPASALGVNNDVSLSYFIANDEMDVVPPITYRYLGVGIESVIPNSGLTTGGTDIVILIAGVSGVSIRGQPVVLVGGSRAVVRQTNFAGVDDEGLSIEATTTAVESPGSAIVEVTINRADLSPIILNATGLFTFILPPDPFIETVVVTGRPRGERWGPTFVASEVTIGIRYLFVGATELSGVRVQFGDFAASVPSSIVSEGDSSDVRLVFTTIVVRTPVVSDPGVVNITVTAMISGADSSIVSPPDLVFEFRDISEALVWGVVPAESSTYGGALMLAGVTGFCGSGQRCPPDSFSVGMDFANGTVAATVFGTVTLQSWLDKDSAYDALTQSAIVGEILAGLGFETVSRMSVVADEIEQFISNNPDTAINGTNSFMILMLSPPSPTPDRSEVVSMTVNGGVYSAAFAFSYLADPEGTAVVEGVFPTRGQLQSGIPVQVQLSNFALVYKPSDVKVKVMLASDGGDIFADVLQIMESSSVRTRIEFELPGIPAAADEYPFAVYPSRNINNNGTFLFEFLGLNLPFVQNYFPSLLYAEGGVTITVVAGNYGSLGITAQDVYIQMTQIVGVNIDIRLVDPFEVTIDGEFVNILFTAPEFEVGEVVAQIVHTGTGDSVEITLTYLEVPTGIAVLTLDPTVGLSTGSELVEMSLTNFRKVDSIEDFVVTFGESELGVESIQRFQSTLEATYLWVFTPSAVAGGEVQVSVKSRNYDINVGFSTFEFIDVNQATLEYIFPIQGDASREHVLDLTIANLGVVITDPIQLDTNWDGVDGLTWDNNRKPIVDSIEFSDVERVDLKLRIQIVTQLSQLAERLPVTLYVGLLGDELTGLKTVSFVFTFIPGGQTYVESFFPVSYFTDGGIPMTIEATNVPPQITRGIISVNFGEATLGNVLQQLPNVSLTSFERLDGDNNDVRMTLTIPEVTLLETQLVTPSLVFAPPWSYVVPFSQQFEYIVPPNVRIVSIFPTTGPTTATTIVTLTVQFFPEVNFNADIRVEFDTVPALVISFARTDETKAPEEVQEISVQVEAPCCTADVFAGETAVVVYHRSFPFRASTPAAYDYFDPDTPTVVAVIGKWGNLVKMSEPTPVTVILSMEPTTESPLITLNGNRLLVTEVSSQEGVNRVSLFFEVNEYVLPGDAVGEIFFVSLGVTTAFTVRYYDDTIPFVLSVAPIEGPETGGTSVMIQLAHNANVVISSAAELLVRFGSKLADVVEVQAVTFEETHIRVLTPPMSVSESQGTLLVAVTIFEIDSQTTTPPFEFTFTDTERAIASVQPTTGSTVGGEVVFVAIEFLPLRLVPRDIVVEFGDTFLAPENISITSATTEVTQLRLVTPGSLPGQVRVTIYPRQDNGADSVFFDFEFVHPFAPVLRDPIPSSSCANATGVTELILVDNLNPLATTSNTLILFGECDWVQPTDIAFAGSIGAISIDVTRTPDPADTSVRVIYPTNQDNALPDGCPSRSSVGETLLTFPYTFLDCRIARVLSYSPASGVHIGGVLVNVRLFLFPADFSVLFATVAVPPEDIRVIYSTEEELNFEFRTPFVYSVGDVEIEVTGFGTNGTVTVLQMPFQTVAPCDYESFCFQQGLVQNVQFRLDSPPTSSECDVEYCIAENLIPYPQILVVSPTEGPTTGATVTMEVSVFPQLEIDQNGQNIDSTVAVEIIALDSTSRGQLTSLVFSGRNVLTSTATLVFDMPPRPPGPVTVVVQSNFGQTASTSLVTRTARFDFAYYRVIFGPAIVDSVSPSQFPLTAAPLLVVSLSNFPLIPAPFDTTAISFQAGSQDPIVGAEAIESSTRDQTVVLISVPSGYLSCSETCNTSLLIFYTIHGVERAGSVNLLLIADPDPVLVGVPIPELILRTSATLVEIRIAHFPLNLFAANLTTTLIQGGLTMSIEIVEGPTYASESCVSVACSSVLIGVQIPADVRLRDDSATIRTCASMSCVDALVDLYSEASAVVRLVDPSMGLTTQPTAVSIFLDNFPVSVPDSDIQVRVGSVAATDIVVQEGRSFERTILACNLQPPLNAGVASGVVWGGNLEIADGASFVFQFNHPPPNVEPVDSPTNFGLTIVTIKFFWGIESIQLSDLTLTIGENVVQRSAYLSGQDELSVTDGQTPRTISFFAPSSSDPQSVEAELRVSDGRLAAAFSFLYFDSPRVVDVQPRQASLEGWVDVTNGNTIRIDVERFPDIIAQSDFSVFFDPLGCNDVSCQIQVEVDSYISSATLLSITVVVPEVDAPLADVGVLVRYTGSFTTQPGQDPDAVRSVREAKSRDVDISFRYLALIPYVEQAQYCESCGSSPCVRGTNCAGSDVGPVEVTLGTSDPGPLEIELPQFADGVLTLKVRHFEQIRDFSKAAESDYAMQAVTVESGEVATLAVTINGVSANVVNVLWSSAIALTFECVPEGLFALGRVTAEVSLTVNRVEGFQDARTTSFAVRLFDPTITVECTEGCAGTVEGGIATTLVLTNFNAVVTSESVNQQIAIHFGQGEATNITVVSSTLTETVLQVFSPECSVCEFVGGRSVVDLEVQLRDAETVFAVTDYTFVEAPRLFDVRFSKVGTSFSVEFDSDTNRGGRPQRGPCSGMLVETALGEGSSCLWNSHSELRVKLGTNPTLVVGDLITFLPGVLKSRDGLSPFFKENDLLSFVIRGPLRPIKPGPMAVVGPQEVDACSGATLRLMATSPRGWNDVQWSCKECGDNTELDLELRRLKTNVIDIPADLLRIQNGEAFQYQISVQVTDFMGTDSDEVTHFLTKKKLPAPMASLLSYQVYSIGSDIFLRGNTFFSNCAVARRETMSFHWTSENIDVDVLNTGGPQLLIPAHTLTADTTYSAEFVVQFDYDETFRSRLTVSFYVGHAPLLAIIDGGDEFEVAQTSELILGSSGSRDLSLNPSDDPEFSYEWTCTYDSDPCRDSNQQLLPTQTGPSFNLGPGVLFASARYVFKLLIRKGENRRASRRCRVDMRAESVPTVRITNDIAEADDESGILRINGLRRLKLRARSDVNPTTFSWSIDPPLLTNSTSALPFGYKGRNLVLTAKRDFELFVPGFVYTISLMGTNRFGLTGTASVQVSVNLPPEGGSCSVCLQGAEDCESQGEALVDDYVVSCSNWADVDQPLQYRFGLSHRRGRIEWMNVLEFPERRFALPSGGITLVVEVLDNLGAASVIFEKAITVARYQRRGRGRRAERALLQTGETEHVDNFLATVEEDLKRAFVEAVFSGVTSVALELDAQDIDDSMRYGYSLRTLQLVSDGLGKLAETVGHFEEAAVAAGAVMLKPCRAEGDSVLAALDITSIISNLKDTWPPASEGFAQNVLEVLASSLASSSSSVCGSLNKISGADATDWMTRTRATLKAVMRSLILQYVDGEDAAEIFSVYANHSAFISSLSSASGDLNLGSVASFALPATDGTTELSIIRGDEILPDFVAEFGTIMLGTVFASLSIFEGGAEVATPGTFTITIPMDEEQSRAVSGNAWTQRANCNFYDETTGQMSYQGCSPIDIQPSYVTCSCNHLTTFSAGLDPGLTYCGDGVIAGDEVCDDANEESRDGCSDSCIIEDGAVCRGSGADGSGPSRCCARCPGGFERIGCDPDPGGVLTDCTQCPDGKYRPPGGRYDDRCLTCDRTEKQIPNETQTGCMFDPLSCGDKELDYWEGCDDGGRVSGDGCSDACIIEEGAICVWNPETNTSVCCARCPAGMGREDDCMPPDALTPCTTCPPGTFRGYGGSHSDRCQACPAATYSTAGALNCTHWPRCDPGEENFNANSTFPGSCALCGPGFWASRDENDAQECLPLGSCPPGQQLVGYGNRSAGSCQPCPVTTYKPIEGNWSTECTPCPTGLFAASGGATDLAQCALFMCGDGARSVVNEECDDGELTNGDGCSSVCTIEDGFICAEDESGLSNCTCAPNQYGENCTVFCSRADNCNGHGSCSADASCSCDRTWIAVDCSFNFPADESYEQAITNVNVVNVMDFGRVTLTFLANSVTQPIMVTADIANDPTAFPSSFLPAEDEDLVFLDGIVDLRPESTTFDPAATMDYALPSDLDARAVPVIATYNYNTEKWERLESVYSQADNSVSAPLSHFSLYAPVSTTPTGTFPPTTTPSEPETTAEGTTVVQTTPEPVETTPAPPIDRGGGGLSDGELAAVIVGPILFVLALIALFLYCRRRQSEPKQPREDTVPLVDSVESPPDPERRDSRELELPQPVDAPATALPPREESEHPPSIPPEEPEVPDDMLGLQTDERQDESDVLGRAAPAGITPVVFDKSPAPGLWTMCRECENPVKTIWPRCPKCKTAVVHDATDMPLMPSEQARVQQKVDLVRVQGQFDLECSNCHAPVKSSWPRCPSCKTETSSGLPVRAAQTPLPDTPQAPTVTAELELAGTPLDRSLPADMMPRGDEESPGLDHIARQAGFDAMCAKCDSPVKSTWPRCPSCKMRIEGGAEEPREPALIEVTPLPPAATAEPAPEPEAAARSARPSVTGSLGVTADIVSAGVELPRRPSGVPSTSTLMTNADEKQLPAILQGMSEPCRMCGGPMKAKWDKCPTCKFPSQPVATSPAAPAAGPAPSTVASITPSAIEKHRRDLGFDQLCVSCQGPVKPTWPRCPTCKTPIPKHAPMPTDFPPSVSQAGSAAPLRAPSEPPMLSDPPMPGQISDPPMPGQVDPALATIPMVSGLPAQGSVPPSAGSVPPAASGLPMPGSVPPSAAGSVPPVAPPQALAMPVSASPAPQAQAPSAEPLPRSPAAAQPLSQHISQVPPLPADLPDPTEAWPPHEAPPGVVVEAAPPIVDGEAPPTPTPSARVVWAGPPRSRPPQSESPEATPAAGSAVPSHQSGMQGVSPPPLSATSETAQSLISGLQASYPPSVAAPPSAAGSAAPSAISGLQASYPPSMATALEGSAPPSVAGARVAPSVGRRSMDIPMEETEEEGEGK